MLDGPLNIKYHLAESEDDLGYYTHTAADSGYCQ